VTIHANASSCGSGTVALADSFTSRLDVQLFEEGHVGQNVIEELDELSATVIK
jgi:hypothetical protein